MDLPWGDERTIQFITNVGIITSRGITGDNIMAAEWTHQVSYSPGLIAVCIRKGNTSGELIKESKEFGVNITATDQAQLASVAGNSHGREVDKVAVLKELGHEFYDAKTINTVMVKGAVLNIECKVIDMLEPGSHTIFIGEVQDVQYNKEKQPLAYHHKQYGTVHFDIPKPSDEVREKIKALIEKHKR